MRWIVVGAFIGTALAIAWELRLRAGNVGVQALETIEPRVQQAGPQTRGRRGRRPVK